MSRQSLLHQLHRLAEPLAHSLGLLVWGMEISSGPRQILRIFLDRDPDLKTEESGEGEDSPLTEQGVGVEQCASFSRLFGLALEVEDIMPGAYVLEVSSPGFERVYFTASQLAGAVGELVDLTFADAPEGKGGRKKFRGRLIAGPVPEKNLDDDSRFVLRLEERDERDEKDEKSEKDGKAGKGKKAAQGAKDLKADKDEAPERERGGEEMLFAFNELKKARRVWIMPEKTRPGKGGGKKQTAG